MVDIEKLDDELYKAIYGLPRIGDYNLIWLYIKNNLEVLREAVGIKKDKFGERDIVRGLTISEAILINYNDVDQIAYNNLIDEIYKNKDIARIVLDGASNGGFSFLLLSLWNPNLKLTEEQKEFAVSEAMNKIGTTKWKQKEEAFSKKMDEMGISDDNTVFVDFGGSVNPIGQKSGSKYMNYMLTSLGREQAHGVGEFDIRYYILRNPNWTLDEKQKLIMDFWYDDEEYEECLDQWEWMVVNDFDNSEYNSVSLFEKDSLYVCDYEHVLDFYKNKEKADNVWCEIQFCRQMRELRPKQCELEFNHKKKTLVK